MHYSAVSNFESGTEPCLVDVSTYLWSLRDRLRTPEHSIDRLRDIDYFSGIAGNRLKVRLAGSITIPTDSSAVTPKIGSALSGPKMTLPAVTSFMNEICASPQLILFYLPIGQFVVQ
jgi:hypothetical protein